MAASGKLEVKMMMGCQQYSTFSKTKAHGLNKNWQWFWNKKALGVELATVESWKSHFFNHGKLDLERFLIQKLLSVLVSVVRLGFRNTRVIEPNIWSRRRFLNQLWRKNLTVCLSSRTSSSWYLSYWYGCQKNENAFFCFLLTGTLWSRIQIDVVRKLWCTLFQWCCFCFCFFVWYVKKLSKPLLAKVKYAKPFISVPHFY